jgi:hypothetical protein
MARRREIPKPPVKLELSFDEVNLVLESLSKRPFIEVYKLIEKIHRQSNADRTQKAKSAE